jgi:hypothetical protein
MVFLRSELACLAVGVQLIPEAVIRKAGDLGPNDRVSIMPAFEHGG